MKKVLSVLLAGAMVASMSVAAFAATAVDYKIYDSDGKENEDIHGTPKYERFMGDITVDGVLPNAELYVPLAATMKSAVAKDKITTEVRYTESAAEMKKLYDEEFNKAAGSTDDEKKTAALSALKSKYEAKGKDDDEKDANTKSFAAADSIEFKDFELITLESLTNKDYFKFDVDKDDGSKYIKKIEVMEDKKLGDLDRTAYLKIQLNDSTTTDDLKATGKITFEAKKSAAEAKVSGENWKDGRDFNMDYTFWINNKGVKGSDGDTGTGDRVYFDPSSNEKNTLVWGDDRAALFFEGNDDAGKFYARLQTKSDSEIYSTYGDPVNADLWFYDFVGNPTVPATSRATLTLGIPWDEDDDYTPKAEDCFIYEKDADGNLTDVTSKFTFDSDNDATTGIEGWSIKTRTLGTYIISDTELDTTVVDEVEETEEPAETTEAPASTGKEIPNTGSSDMVGAAVVAAVVSLAAAGAVAFKKASK